MNTSNQQRVMHWAHAIYQSADCTWSEALQTAWTIHYVRQYLKRGVIRFTYLKHDGTWREARGTLNPDIIPPSKLPKGTLAREIALGLKEPNYKSIAYYDLDKEAWRAFDVSRFYQVTGITVLDRPERVDHTWATCSTQSLHRVGQS